jgi:hypothetical protein
MAHQLYISKDFIDFLDFSFSKENRSSTIIQAYSVVYDLRLGASLESMEKDRLNSLYMVLVGYCAAIGDDHISKNLMEQCYNVLFLSKTNL